MKTDVHFTLGTPADVARLHSLRRQVSRALDKRLAKPGRKGAAQIRELKMDPDYAKA